MSRIIDTVKALAQPIIEKNGCELWNIEYVKEAGGWYLRIFIDRPEGISIDLCEAVSRELDPLLDEYEDLIPDSYTFEVSSAGVERKLRGPSDFERFSGSFVEVRLYKAKNGSKKYLGELAAWSENGLELDAAGQRFSFTKDEVTGVWLKLK